MDKSDWAFATTIAAVILFFVIFITWALVDDQNDDHKCHRAGGIVVDNTCLDKRVEVKVP